MNELALALKKALSDAVDSHKDKGVYWIDYDKYFDGHRFCDREEPNPNDPETWFFNYYTKDDPKSAVAQRIFEKIPTYQTSVKGGKDGAFKSDEDFINALADAAEGDPEAQSFLSDTVRMFHPSTRGHEKIRDVVHKFLDDNGVSIEGASAQSPAAPQPPKCYGVSGDTWMLSRDQAVSAAEQFCRQGDKDLE